MSGFGGGGRHERRWWLSGEKKHEVGNFEPAKYGN